MPQNLTDYQRDVWHAGLNTICAGAQGTLVTRGYTKTDPITGATTTTSTNYTLTMGKFNYRESRIDNTNVKSGDARIYISAKDAVVAGVEPKKDDIIELDNSRWKIISLRKIEPNFADDPIGYIAQCREESQ